MVGENLMYSLMTNNLLSYGMGIGICEGQINAA